MNTHYIDCNRCGGEGDDCPSCDGEGVLVMDILHTPIPAHHKAEKKLAALRDDANRIVDQHRRLCLLKPFMSKRYSIQLMETMDAINAEAAHIYDNA